MSDDTANNVASLLAAMEALVDAQKRENQTLREIGVLKDEQMACLSKHVDVLIATLQYIVVDKEAVLPSAMRKQIEIMVLEHSMRQNLSQE